MSTRHVAVVAGAGPVGIQALRIVFLKVRPQADGYAGSGHGCSPVLNWEPRLIVGKDGWQLDYSMAEACAQEEMEPKCTAGAVIDLSARTIDFADQDRS